MYCEYFHGTAESLNIPPVRLKVASPGMTCHENTNTTPTNERTIDLILIGSQSPRPGGLAQERDGAFPLFGMIGHVGECTESFC